MVEYFSQHLDYFFYALAGICLLVDLSILGMSGPLLFIGIGALITGAFLSLGLLEHFSASLAVFAGFSAASAALLWAPLKRLQNKEVGPEITSDMVGKIIPASARITKTDGRVYYSGVEWLARLDSSSDEPIEAETQVRVTSVDGTIMLVRVA
jgi:inner membrane protein